MREIDINGNTYRIGDLNAMRQFHLARRLAPIQLALGLNLSKVKIPVAAQDETQEGAVAELMDGEEIMAVFAGMMEPIIQELAKMPQADVDYLMNECLSVVQRKQGDRFAPIMTASNQMLFADIKMQQLIRLCIEVVRENLGDFFGQGLAGIA